MQTTSKYMKRAKTAVLEWTIAGTPLFTAADIATMDPLELKLLAFVKHKGILNLFNDWASQHAVRVAAFHIAETTFR